MANGNESAQDMLYNYIKDGMSIEDIFREYRYPTEYTIYHLQKPCSDVSKYMKICKYLKDYYDQFKINDDKVLIITDTHLVGPFGRFEFIKYVYEYAKANNYKYIVHLGDLIEGQCNPHIRTISNNEQLKCVTKNYPYNSDIITYFVMGNHDSCNYEFINELKQLNIFYIGGNMSYVYFDNLSRIKVIHDGIKSDYVPYYPYDIKLKGHTHKFYLGDHIVKCRPLGDFKNSTYSDYSSPGFESIKLDQDGYIFEDYLVTENGINKSEFKTKMKYLHK